ncbi:Cystathionine beta-lyase, Bsu PatB [Pediococcus damnosus]|uniref:Cystathionine beta-lyase, Bsu PatB n=1 Tax=Pediococcus damnosus TaxID=51663 RepID=A0ABN4NAV8_9LACO|nr:Cystathionine beta-lyase, Bsu PatB [Pediococcus damnosus]AMV65674.1 Cystathionine beta-lyase, Bsu PatB [Pediococcus damnosus]AMV67809.1 Cystathionine beta-lyase, Bsu PatB [Pediococcus damnosus]KRN53862.1 hypothetical protein IV84_GL001183 [Pediococcus damnosus]
MHLGEHQATYLAWLDFRDYARSQTELNHLLWQQAKVGLESGNQFGKTGTGFMRLNFGCPRSVLKQGLQQITAVFKDQPLR